METKVSNKIKIRNISPIKRNKEEIHTINQNTVTSNKSTNYATKTKTSKNSVLLVILNKNRYVIASANHCCPLLW